MWQNNFICYKALSWKKVSILWIIPPSLSLESPQVWLLKVLGGERHEGHLAATTLREGTGGDGAPSRAFTWLLIPLASA